MRPLAITALLVCTASLTLISASEARADKAFDLDHLQLSLLGGDFAGTESAGRIQPWFWRAGVAYRYSDAPLVLDQGNKIVPLIGARHILSVNGAIEFSKWVGLGVELPVLLAETGAVSGGAALGDLRLQPRIEILRGQTIGLAALLGLRLPTGSTTRFLGEGNVVFEPRIAAEYYIKMFRIGANLGVRIRQSHQFIDLHIGDEGFVSLAFAAVPKPYITAFTEFHADTALSSQFGKEQSSPVEWLIGANGGWLGFRAGAVLGVGIVPGYGQPRLRVLATLEYRRPAPKPVPKPVPPTAKPPEKPPEPPKPPTEPLPDIDDEVELPDVYPDEPDVTITPGQIELSKPVFFDTNRKRIHHQFLDELGQLGRALNRRPELTTVWIEGHADATGPARWNLYLSRLRAAEVGRYLAKHGVDRARIKAVGYGEAHLPVQETGANRENRSVHFFTEVSAPDATPAGDVLARRGKLKAHHKRGDAKKKDKSSPKEVAPKKGGQ